MSQDTAWFVDSVAGHIAWLRTDGVLHIEAADGPRNIPLPCVPGPDVVYAPPCDAISVTLGDTPSGNAVAVVVLARRGTKQLVEIPLGAGRQHRLPLPTGTFAAARHGRRLVIAVGRARTADGNVTMMRGVFERRHRRWFQVSKTANILGFQQAGRYALVDANMPGFNRRQLRLIDLARPGRPRVLAYAGPGLPCPDRTVCTEYGRAQLTRRYAYFTETGATNGATLDDYASASYLCRVDLDDPSDVVRWQTPGSIEPYHVIGDTVYAALRNAVGDPAPGIVTYTPQWMPATQATPFEFNGPCSTRGPGY